MDLNQITPLILTWNEATNISRCLKPLFWAKHIVILDSGSPDKTATFASAFANVALYTRPFDTHSEQWNHGLSLVQSDWVLALDADYITDQKFAQEIEGIAPKPGTNAFFARFIYCVSGRQLRASLYPPRAVLLRRGKAHYVQDGHTQLLHFVGEAGHLSVPILHDDRKSLGQWLQAQDRYSRLEAQHLLATSIRNLSGRDRLRRKIFFAALVIFLYLLFARGLILDGWPGWFYVCQRTIAELMLSVRLLVERERLEEKTEDGRWKMEDGTDNC